MEIIKPTILVVDDESNNIRLLNQILKGLYIIRVAMNGKEVLERVLIAPIPDLILLDIMMPEMDGYEVCRRLKSDPATSAIPVIFATAKTEVEDETVGFEVGAVDYITKPLSAPVVRARVATHLSLADQQKACEAKVQARIAELASTQEAAIHMLGEAGHYNDTDTGVHIWRMAAYAGALAQSINWSVEMVKDLELAAPMHDTGKIGIPDSILKAPRKLEPDEMEKMKKHSEIGFSILSKSNTPLFTLAAEISLYHHEKWDGSGYPKCLVGNSIPESARIVAIADVFDALTMRRPYKEPWPVEKAFATIEEGEGNHFDPNLVQQFIQIKDKVLEIKDKWDKKEKTKTGQIPTR